MGMARTTRGCMFAHSALGCPVGLCFLVYASRFRCKSLPGTDTIRGLLSGRLPNESRAPMQILLNHAYFLETQQHYRDSIYRLNPVSILLGRIGCEEKKRTIAYGSLFSSYLRDQARFVMRFLLFIHPFTPICELR